jgi:DNA-binding phage protein
MLKEILKEQEKSVSAVAKEVGCSRTYLYKLMAKKIKNPGTLLTSNLAKTLNLKIEDLILILNEKNNKR